MNTLMTTTADARKLIGFDCSQDLRIGRMNRTFLKVSGALVTMKTLPVVVWRIKLNVGRFGNPAQILHINVM